MGIMKEAIDKEDWERAQKGLKPRPKPPKVMPKYDMPKVPNHITLDQIPIAEVIGFYSAPRTVKSAEGVRFIGHDVTLNIKDKKPVNGWMTDGDLIKLGQLTGRIQGR